MMRSMKWGTLARSVVSGLSWNVTGGAIRALCSFLLNIVLARLLGPAPFGVISLASVVIGLAGMLSDWGLSAALIQKLDLRAHDIAYVFGFQLTSAVGLALLVAGTAPIVAGLFAEPGLTNVLRALSLTLIIQAIGQASSALLARRMNFRRLQEVQFASYLMGYLGLGLPLALRGCGVWSLVAAQICQALVSSLIFFLSAPHSLAVTLHAPPDIHRFGGRVLAANVAAWLVPNLENAVVGWRFGSTELGYFGRSYNLSLTPVGIFVNSAQSVLFPAISQVRKGAQASRLFTSFLASFCAVLVPGYCLVALGAPDIILLLYGSGWVPAAPLLTPLALAMLAFSLGELGTPVLMGLGLPRVQLQVEWKIAGFAPLLLLGASRMSLVATAWGVLLIYALRLALMSTQILKALGTTWWSFVRPVLSGCFLALCACTGWLLAGACLPSTLAFAVRVLCKVACALGLWITALLLGWNLLFPDLKASYEYLVSLRRIED